jgi:drug/metabolite transporter (DMT)-like permease
MNTNPQFKIILYLMIPPILWAGNAVAGKFASAFIGPFSLSFYRWLFASGLLLIIAAKPLYLSRSILLENWKSLAILGILGTGMFNTLLYLGLNSTSASNTGIIQATLPIMIILLNYFMGMERASATQIAGMIISLTGVVWVITQGELMRLLQFELNPGDLIILVAVFTWALYSVLLKKLRPTALPTLPFLAIQFLVGLAFIFPFFVYEQSQGSSILWNKQTVLVLTYVAIFPSLIAFFFWQQGVAMGGANIAGFISPLITVFTAALAYIFLHESLNSAQITGAILVISGVILALSNSLRAKTG